MKTLATLKTLPTSLKKFVSLFMILIFILTPLLAKAADGCTIGQAAIGECEIGSSAPVYDIEVWPAALNPEGDIDVYVKFWKDDVVFSPTHIIVELRKSSGNTLEDTHMLVNGALGGSHCDEEIPANCLTSGDGLVYAGDYSTRLDSTDRPDSEGNAIGSAKYKTTFSAPVAGDYRVKAYAYNANFALLDSDFHADFPETPAVDPVVTLNALTSPTNTNPYTVGGTIVELNLDTFTINGLTVARSTSDNLNYTYSTGFTLSEGSNLITATATDESGNTGTATGNITLDTVAPTAPSISTLQDNNPPEGGSTAGWSRSGEIQLAWTAGMDETTGIDYYEVYRKATQLSGSGEAYDFTLVSTITGGAVTYTDTGRFNDTSYDYKIKSFDGVGNNVESSSANIKVDTENPGNTITSPSPSSYSNNNTIQVSTNYGNTNLVTCQSSKNGGSSWEDMTGDNLVSGTATGAYTGVADGIYAIDTKCTDQSNNTGLNQVTGVTIDTQDPSAAIMISGGTPAVTSTAVTLTLNYSDSGPAGVADPGCRYANDEQELLSASYETCSSSKAWNLDSTPGTKTVYYEVKDKAGNTTTSSDTVILGSEQAPEAHYMDIGGYKISGQELTGLYLYSDADSDPEGTSTYRWLRSNTTSPAGSYTAITGATAITYTSQVADETKYLKFEVTPVSTTGTPNTGVATTTNAFGPIYGSEAQHDYSSGTGTEVEFDTQNAGIVQPTAGTTMLNLGANQLFNFAAALTQPDPTGITVSGSTTVEQALNQLKPGGFSGNTTDSIVFESGIDGEDLVISSSDGLDIVIPDGTTAYGDTSWDGTFAPPTNFIVVTPPANREAIQAISVGVSNETLIVSNPVKLEIDSDSGTPYFSNDGGNTWTQMTRQCGDTTGLGITFPNECYIKTGGKTIIWTYHLTEYGVFDPVAGTVQTQAQLEITAGDVTISAPALLNFGTGEVSSSTQTVTLDMTTYSGGSLYFDLQDLKGSDSGYYTTIDIENLTVTGTSKQIDATNVYITLTGTNSDITGLDGLTGTGTGYTDGLQDIPPEVQIPSGTPITYIPIDSPLTILRRDDPTTPDSAILGKYGIQPKFDIEVPKYQEIGDYESTITFTLVEQ